MWSARQRRGLPLRVVPTGYPVGARFLLRMGVVYAKSRLTLVPGAFKSDEIDLRSAGMATEVHAFAAAPVPGSRIAQGDVANSRAQRFGGAHVFWRVRATVAAMQAAKS